jgi:hypothetical protein
MRKFLVHHWSVRLRLPISAFCCLAIASGAHAQTWKDAASGQTVASGPILSGRRDLDPSLARPGIDAGHYEGILPDAGDPNRAFDPVTGRNFFFDRDKCIWKDAATGQTVASGPILSGRRDLDPSLARPGIEAGHYEGILADAGDPNRAFDPVTGRNFVRDPCPSQRTTTTTPPPSEQGTVVPRTGPTQPLGGFYVGGGGSYFFEPGTQIGLASALVGYRLTPHIGIEVQGDVGVTKDKFDNGSTFKSSTGIDWSLYPMVSGYLPVSDTTDLILHFGYGLTRFGNKATSFSGSSSTSFENHNTVGTGIVGGGADIGIGGDSSLRVEYDRLFFDNGSEGNRVSLSFVHTFGLRASELTGFPGPGGNPGAVPPPPPTPPPPAPPPPPPQE